MIKTNKISNLNRLNFKNKLIVVLYLVKTLFKIKHSANEFRVYVYYNYLINLNGFFVSETSNHYDSEFKNIYPKVIRLRKYPSSDMDVFHQIYVSKEYAPIVETYIENFPFLSDFALNIIDAGSNIGLTTLFFLKHFKKSNIISIEPEEENFKMLDFNVDSKFGRVLKVKGAIWYSNSKVKILNDFRDRQDWAFRVEESNSDEGVKSYTINQLAKDNEFKVIDILKIDIEGSEKLIFDPKVSNLEFLKITKCIAIEIHDEFNCREDIYKVLKCNNFEFSIYGQTTIGINKNFK